MVVSSVQVRAAIDNGALSPVFQPIVDLRTGLVMGFEVLARWDHPRHGLILPGNFIHLAEKDGLIDRLADQVLRKAFLAATRLRPDSFLSINISPLQLRHRRLASRLRKLCSETGMAAERLTIEITESAIIDNLQMASRVAGDLKEMGCRLSLDDFGTGYSSLVHLQALPFDELKVDRSFVRDCTTRRESRKIVSGVIEMGKALGLRTVAEGVEAEDQCNLLFRLGCHSGQGWLYGKPMPAPELPKCNQCAMLCDCVGLRARDADQLVRMNVAVTDQAAQLKAIYNSAPVGLCLLDINMRYVSINRQLAEMNGHTEQEHIGRTPREMIPDLYPELEPHLNAALQGVRQSPFEVCLRRNHVDQTMSVTYEPVYDETVEMIGVSVAVVDVTDRVQAESAIRARVDSYRSLMAVSPFMSWSAGPELDILEVSPKWLELTGLAEKDVLEMGWMRAIDADDVLARSQEIIQALQRREPFDVQYRVRTARGEWIWVRCKGWPRFTRTGELAGWCGFIVDVEQHRVETEKMLTRLQDLRAVRMSSEHTMN